MLEISDQARNLVLEESPCLLRPAWHTSHARERAPPGMRAARRIRARACACMCRSRLKKEGGRAPRQRARARLRMHVPQQVEEGGQQVPLAAGEQAAQRPALGRALGRQLQRADQLLVHAPAAPGPGLSRALPGHACAAAAGRRAAQCPASSGQHATA